VSAAWASLTPVTPTSSAPCPLNRLRLHDLCSICAQGSQTTALEPLLLNGSKLSLQPRMMTMRFEDEVLGLGFGGNADLLLLLCNCACSWRVAILSPQFYVIPLGFWIAIWWMSMEVSKLFKIEALVFLSVLFLLCTLLLKGLRFMIGFLWQLDSLSFKALWLLCVSGKECRTEVW
jgi:hypothetical protein